MLSTVVLWPLIVLFIVDILIVIGAILKTYIPFYLCYVICLIAPPPMNITMFVYTVSSEIWWVGLAVLIIGCVQLYIHVPMLIVLSLVAVICPCMGLALPEQQIFYFVVLCHVLVELTALRTSTRPKRVLKSLKVV